MRLVRLATRGFRNLADPDLEFPAEGVALLGDNAQGKTNFLEAVGYPVLWRSLHRVPDQQVAAFGGEGFRVEATVATDSGSHALAAVYRTSGRRKQVEVDDAPAPKLTEAVGHWLAVAFLPADLQLASGPAGERRLYLDRMLALADGSYLRALSRYRAALAQRNAALRQRRADLARPFHAAMGAAGAEIVRTRLGWVAAHQEAFAEELAALGEAALAGLAYEGEADLADPGAWPEVLERSLEPDMGRGLTSTGPHRHELALRLDGRAVRAFGSTGQQRGAAIALKLLELRTLREARGVEPALLLDDIFAELDRERQDRLGRRLDADARQLFLSAPRPDELPAALARPVWTIRAGRITTHGGRQA